MTVNNINVSETLKSVENLLREDKTSSPQVRAMMELLVVVIQLLVGKLNLNSSNSSKPPSSDPNRARPSKAVKENKKKPGGQLGSEGSNLKQVENPDKIKNIPIDRKTLPSGQYKNVGYESRQVIDILISRQVTEYRAEILEDRQGGRFVAEFPKEVSRPIQYGASLRSQAVYMSQQQLIPYDRIQDYFCDQCGITISTGSLFNFNKEAYERLADFERVAKQQLIIAELLHADETGININGKRLWLHCASNDLWTLLFPHHKRGGEAVKAMGILEHFTGILCHDHWKPYFQLNCLHALCNAHHLRELKYAWEEDGQKWAKNMHDLLVKTNDAVKEAGGALAKKNANKFLKRYRAILARADSECPLSAKSKEKPKRGRVAKSKSRNLLDRLRKFEGETLRFMTDKRVPFTNNQGENDIRMTKVQQKISGCFRSFEGASIFCRVRGYLITCRKHGVQATDALRMLFEGKSPDFLKALE